VGIGNGVFFNTLNPFLLISKHRLADFITVHISGEDTQDGQSKTVVVEIENAAIVKPFLCGYRDKNTGKEYLDAFTQTGPYFDKMKYRKYKSRDTQTWEHKEKILVGYKNISLHFAFDYPKIPSRTPPMSSRCNAIWMASISCMFPQPMTSQ